MYNDVDTLGSNVLPRDIPSGMLTVSLVGCHFVQMLVS